MKVQNRLKEILVEKQIEELKPSETLLARWNIDIRSWNKWINKKSNPPFELVPAIAEFLNVEINEIFPLDEHEKKMVADKYRLIKEQKKNRLNSQDKAVINQL